MSDDEDLSVVKENLLCPVCDGYMYAPIRQCKTGHSICDQCFSKIKRCPKCRGPKSEGRCYALESIAAKLMLSCRFKNIGCKFAAKGEAISFHEKDCSYSPISCPFRTYDNCSWVGYTSKLNNHCTKKHRNNFYSRGKQKFLALNFNKIKTYHYIYVLIHAYNQYFRLTWELDDETGITRWAIYLMGTKENAKKFAYKIEFPKDKHVEFEDISRSLVFRSPCDVLPHDDAEKFIPHNYLMVHRDLLNTYCEESGDLNYTATIYKTTYVGESDSDNVRRGGNEVESEND